MNRSTLASLGFAVGALLVAGGVSAQEWDFSYSFGDPSSTAGQEYVAGLDNAEIWTEGGEVTYWKPIVGGETFGTTSPGVVLFRFPFDREVSRAHLRVVMTTFQWSYSQGHGRLRASADGTTWELLLDVPPPAFGGANIGVYDADLPASLLGTREIWVRPELYSYGPEAPTGGVWTNTAQLCRWTAGAPSTTFQLDVAFARPTIPRPETPVSPSGVTVGPAVGSATDRGGNRVVVWWQDEPRAGIAAGVPGKLLDGAGVFGRLFDPEDQPVGDPFVVASGVTTAAPDVAYSGDGGVVVTWQGEGGLFGRTFGSDLAPTTAPFPLVDGQVGVAEQPAVASAAAGDFAVAWRSAGAAKDGGGGVFGRFFEPDGTPKGDEVRVDSGSVLQTSLPDVAAGATGSSFVVWQQLAAGKQGGDGVFGRLFNPAGDPMGDPIPVDNGVGDAEEPSVAASAAGDLVAVWAQDGGDVDGWDVQGRLFDAEGQPAGSQFRVNSVVAGDQRAASVGVNSAGDFAVAWASDDDGIFARFFSAGGAPLGPQFVVAEPEGGLTPTSPEVSVAGDDTVTVAYTRTAADGTPQGVFLRAFEISSGPSTCVADGSTLCLNGGRFQVRVSWRDFVDNTGAGQAVPLTDDTGTFWFFSDTNVELVLKVLDGTGINGSFWVFYGALSNVEYTIVVTDTSTGSSVTYLNPSGTFASVGDTAALPGTPKAAPRHVVREVERQAWPGEVGDAMLPLALDACEPGDTTLCLNGNRFRVEVEWSDFQGNTGVGRTVPLTADTGTFWFFNQDNVELVVKVLDATVINQRYWVFYGALSNVEYTITVTDTQTGRVRTYTNPSGSFGSVGDTDAFPAP